MSKINLEKAIEMRDSGKKLREIAEHFDCTIGAVNALLARNKTKKYSTKEVMAIIKENEFAKSFFKQIIKICEKGLKE